MKDIDIDNVLSDRASINSGDNNQSEPSFDSKILYVDKIVLDD